MPDEAEPAQHDLLVAFLKDRDAPCPHCQYNLRNLTITTCPECGKTIELAVKAHEVSVQPWATLVVALSLPAGVGIFFVLMCIRTRWPRLNHPEALLVYTSIGMIPLAITAAVMRQKFLRLSRTAQFGISAFAVGSAVLLFFFLRLLA